jgi:cell division protein FtsX
MSDPMPLPTADAPSLPPAPDRSSRRRRLILLVVVAGAAMLVGVIAATAVFLFSGEDGPLNRYQVTVFLDHDITAEQKGAVESALADLHPVDGVRFETRDQAWEKFREMFKDQPELIERVEAEHLPESFGLATTGEVFDCAALASVRQLPGVADTTVVQVPAGGRPGAVIQCP